MAEDCRAKDHNVYSIVVAATKGGRGHEFPILEVREG